MNCMRRVSSSRETLSAANEKREASYAGIVMAPSRRFGTNHTLVFVAGFKVTSGPRGFGMSGLSGKQHSGFVRKISHKRQASPGYYSEM
jgi:hypothetical protein